MNSDVFPSTSMWLLLSIFCNTFANRCLRCWTIRVCSDRRARVCVCGGRQGSGSTKCLCVCVFWLSFSPACLTTYFLQPDNVCYQMLIAAARTTSMASTYHHRNIRIHAQVRRWLTLVTRESNRSYSICLHVSGEEGWRYLPFPTFLLPPLYDKC